MPLVNVTIPVFNEEARLARCIPRLHSFLAQHCRFAWEIVVANNASTDQTQAVGERLARDYGNVHCLWIPEKGRGGALRAAWSASAANVVSYMDVDLSTDLSAFPALVEALLPGGFDVAIGSRLLKPAWTTRGWKREIASRSYNMLLRWILGVGFSDAQCGFKALTSQACRNLLPQVRDNAWFFDTELLILAERQGWRVFEMPVRWTDDWDSRVRVVSTAWKDIQGMLRMRRSLRRAPPGRCPSQTRRQMEQANPRSRAV